MRYQTVLGNDEYKGWIKIEVNLGKNDTLIKTEKARLLNFLKSFSDVDATRLKQHTSYEMNSSVTDLPVNRTTVRYLLIKKFIDKNKPSVIAEALGFRMTGKALETEIFIHIAEKIFQQNHLPEDLYVYCTFRRRGSPTTWLKINNGLSEADLIKVVQEKAVSLCNKLTYALGFRRRIRSEQTVGGFLIFILEKPAGADVARTEDANQEIQKIGYSLFVVNLGEKKIGFVSNGKREVAIAQKFIKEKIFPEEVFAPRNDVNKNATELLEKLLPVEQENAPLEIVGFSLKDTKLPSNPSLKLENTDGSPINTAIGDMKRVWEGLDISSIKAIDYKFNGQKVAVYSYGDDWKRRFLNISSKGKSKIIEDYALQQLESVIGVTLKEVRFVTEELSLDFIIDKILKDKAVSIDPPIPAAAEKVIVELVRDGLLKKPKTIAKRRCSNWNCRTISWADWMCPNCGRDMYIIGESITIEVSDAKFLEKLAQLLSISLADYEITKQQMQRKKHKKSVIRIVNLKKNIAIYIVPVLSKKDMNFCEALSKEGYGLIAICDPRMNTRREELELYGSSFLEFSKLLAGLKNKLDGKASLVVDDLTETIKSQEDTMLVRVHQRLVESAKTLKEKGSDYDEDIFEIDLKNILQALVPNVVRLGTKFKGKSVPDGYCAFKLPHIKPTYLFGWDAKYSFSSSYKLKSPDFDKQINYIKWLGKDKEPKALGRLRLYAIVSNFDTPEGFQRVLTRLRRSREKPALCRVILIHDSLLAEVASWMLSNWKTVIEKNPLISQTVFEWILSEKRKTINKWTICSKDDWAELEQELNKLINS